jgi:hypothetical protein
MQTRKDTAWRKSRKFGDIHGGRTRLRLADNIFSRAHSLKRPGPGAEIPIFIVDNPSRDFFFPVSEEDVRKTLNSLPAICRAFLTHVWLRRVRKSDYETKTKPLASFIAGSGVRLIVLYSWPKDLLLRFGDRKPSKRRLRRYAPWGPELIKEGGEWCLRWSEDQLRLFYIQHLLLHEIGHHVDYFCRRWSKANKKQVEEFADQYAVEWSAVAKTVLDGDPATTSAGESRPPEA